MLIIPFLLLLLHVRYILIVRSVTYPGSVPSSRHAIDYSGEKLPTGAPEVVELGDSSDLPPEKAGTVYDRKDMRRVGKEQELRVCYILEEDSPPCTVPAPLISARETSAWSPSLASLRC